MLLSLITACLRKLHPVQAYVSVSEDELLTREKELIAQWTPDLTAQAHREGWSTLR